MERKRKLLRWVLSLGVVLFMLITNAEKADAATCMHKTATKKVSPTCTKSGYERVYCSKCNTQFSYKTLSALGHNKVTVTLRGATCTQTGAYCLRCTRCNATDPTFNTPALGHNLSTSTTKNATCTATGTSTTKCSRCTYSYNTTIGKLGHNMVTTSETAATCTAGGSRTQKCTRCSHSTTTSTGGALGHSYAALNCTQDKCTRCSSVRSGGVGHVKTSREDKKPTCTETGTRQYYCALCGTGMGTDIIPATGHTLTTKTTKATCTKAAYLITYCATCNAESSRVVAQKALGHNYAKRISCEKALACTRCNKVNPSGPVAGHEYEGATCTSGGTCKHCGSILFYAEPQHQWDPNKKPCQKNTCKVCGAVKEAVESHNYVFVSCTEPYKCSKCNTAQVPAKAPGHLLSAANCKEDRHCTRPGCKYVAANTKLSHEFDENVKPRGTVIGTDNNTCYHESKCKNCGEWVKCAHTINFVSLAGKDQHVRACHCFGLNDCDYALEAPAACDYETHYYSFQWTQKDTYLMVARTCKTCKTTIISINNHGKSQKVVDIPQLLRVTVHEIGNATVGIIADAVGSSAVAGALIFYPIANAVAEKLVTMYFESPFFETNPKDLVSYIKAASRSMNGSDAFVEYTGSDPEKLTIRNQLFSDFDYSSTVCYTDGLTCIVSEKDLNWK